MATGFYRGSTGLSPHRILRSHGDLTATKMKTKELAQDVEEAVEEDFTHHYRVTDTEQFLNKLFPIENATLELILQDVEELYDSQTQRWKGFPKKETKKGKNKKKKKIKENSLYGPFCAIAEAIRGFSEKRRATASQMGDTKWMDYHSNSPRTQDKQAAQLRPDALMALRVFTDQEGEQTGGHEDNQKKQGKPPHPIWWLQIIAAVEMKPTDPKNWETVVKQLIGYLRRILREQLDRRFVFGLTLGPDMMTVWMHDRSGVVGTKTAINIHKEPLEFIRVIAAFSLFSPDKLGFDPTIEMLVSPDQSVPSYRPNKEFIQAYRTARHNRQWVIRMNDGTRYKTVETVSSVRAGFMRGRGSIAWVVVPFDSDKGKEAPEFFVLKQSWLPDGVENEGVLYEGCSCENVGKIELCEEVLISGWKDSTNTLIRSGLDDLTGLGKHARDDDGVQEEIEHREPKIHVTCTEIGDIKEVVARQTGPPVARVRTRVVLSTYGWLIKYFSTRKELLVVLRDAIRGHKYLYEKGVLHRDISPGNILIKWQPGSEADEPSSSGCLIDLDHARKGVDVERAMKVQLAKDAAKKATDLEQAKKEIDLEHAKKAELAKDDAQKAIELTQSWCSWKSVAPDVARQAIVFFPIDDDPIDLLAYLKATLAHASEFRHLNGPLCTPEHLRWKQVKTLYDFKFSKARERSRTGTPPYTSGEILLAERYFDHEDILFHDAVHDLESFFWVLNHICVTRKGPGGIRREELEEKNQGNEDSNGLIQVVYYLFDSETKTMGSNKREIFKHPKEFETYVLNNFHGYFLPLRDVVREWYHLLILAHKFHAYEYVNIHDMVLEILDRAIESAAVEEISEATQKVLEDRKANIEKLSAGNPFGKVQQPPPPHTSPSSQRYVSQPVYLPSPSSPTPAPKKGKTRR